jgi:DNA end-binding protein Ku
LPEHEGEGVARRRSIWSGTITFGLVSIPVDMLSAIRPRQTAMRMVDAKGRLLGREYVCPADGKTLSGDDIIRGYETDDGKMVVVTDEELDAIAPQLSRDIELRRFVPLEQIPPAYYVRPYFLAPAGRSVKAYQLLAQTMAQARRVGIGSFVLRGHVYGVAFLSAAALRRPETLRFADELRTPEDVVGLPQRPKVGQKRVRAFAKAIGALKRDELDPDELADRYASRIEDLVAAKQKKDEDVVELGEDEEAREGREAGGAEIIDLMALLKKRLSAKARVTTVDEKRSSNQGSPTQRSATKSSSAKGSPEALGELSKSELYRRAGRLGIAGRSRMDKAALVKAIRKAS